MYSKRSGVGGLQHSTPRPASIISICTYSEHRSPEGSRNRLSHSACYSNVTVLQGKQQLIIILMHVTVTVAIFAVYLLVVLLQLQEL